MSAIRRAVKNQMGSWNPEERIIEKRHHDLIEQLKNEKKIQS